MSSCQSEVNSVKNCVVRKPIFDRQKSIWGFEFTANALSALPGGENIDSLTDLIAAYQESIVSAHQVHLKALLTIPDGTRLADANFHESWQGCVFEMCDQPTSDGECIDFVSAFTEKGGCLAINGEMDAEAFKEMAGVDDIVKISLAEKTPSEIIKVRKSYKGFDRNLLATDIADWESYEGTRALGFSYFQGSFFEIAEAPQGGKLSAGAAAKLLLLKELNDPNCDMKELADIVGTDVSLSYRLLKYINSAAFGLSNKIKSLNQAVALLGLNEVRHWAMVVLMSDVDASPKGQELAYMALQRARFLKQFADCTPEVTHSSETMFLLGLFSTLDALMAYPMDALLEELPLDGGLKEALCGRSNEYSEWIQFVKALERSEWSAAIAVLEAHGGTMPSVAAEYMRASSWAAEQLVGMKL